MNIECKKIEEWDGEDLIKLYSQLHAALYWSNWRELAWVKEHLRALVLLLHLLLQDGKIVLLSIKPTPIWIVWFQSESRRCTLRLVHHSLFTTFLVDGHWLVQSIRVVLLMCLTTGQVGSRSMIFLLRREQLAIIDNRVVVGVSFVTDPKHNVWDLLSLAVFHCAACCDEAE